MLARLGTVGVMAQGAGEMWPLTTDGRSRFAGWSPDGRTVLINHWGEVVGDRATRQMLSELWAVGLQGSPAIRLSQNALQPAYSGDQQQLAYLAFVADGRWEIKVLDLVTGQETTWRPADWRMKPIWVGEALAFAREGKVYMRGKGPRAATALLPALPPRAQVRLSADGHRVAWSDGTHLWAVDVSEARGGEPRLLAAGTQVLSFAWSPDGCRLAYIIAAQSPSPELWVACAEGDKAPMLLLRGEMEVFSTPTWSPDGEELAFSRTPLGAATGSASEIWLVSAEGGNLRPLEVNDLEESSPAWSPDGRYLAVNRAGDVWVMDVSRLGTEAPPNRQAGRAYTAGPSEDSSNLAPPVNDGRVKPLAQHTPPDVIRVMHDPCNLCRNVPPGQIDFIPFEEYVKRVVPPEMPTSWPAEALKSQAVAARTYGWKHVLNPSGPNWDVTDWTGHQVMCDATYPSTNAAVDATRGQYVAWQGQVIYAMYSAENGSPTKTWVTAAFPNGVPYLMAVDDPVGFGQPIRGHGSGLSQWGAYRWAAWHGWGYQQILSHYYTGVTVELPSTGGPVPMGGVMRPWSNHFVTSNRIHIVANASDERSAVHGVGFYVLTDTASLLVTDTVGSDGWSTTWDVSTLSDTTSTSLVLSALIADTDANVQPQSESVHIGLDRHPPIDTTATISDAYIHTLTATLSSLSASDQGPGSGAQTMAFSNEGWSWEGEDLYLEWGSGKSIDDEGALNGKARCGLVGEHSPGAWYGPYTYGLPPGHAYRAYFRLKTNNVTTTAEVAMLDVVDNAGECVLGLRRLHGTDFRVSDTYQEFPVDFNYTSAGTAGLEFRTAFRATADLYLDRVLIVRYPVTIAPNAQWRLSPGEGLKVVTIKFMDGAGNVSADLTRTVTVSDITPPTGWREFAPEWWSGGRPPTCTVQVFDDISGLNVDSARYRFSTDGGVSWGDWSEAGCTGISGTTEVQTIAASGVPFGRPRERDNHIEFQIADMKGYTGSMSYIVQSNLLYLPLIAKAEKASPPSSTPPYSNKNAPFLLGLV